MISRAPGLRSHACANRASIAVIALLLVGACERNERPPAGWRLTIGELLGGVDTLHERATEPRDFTFPRDHGPHPGFRTEWWYFTGNLTSDDGREVGYQLTFFRTALTDSASFARRSAARDERSGADPRSVGSGTDSPSGADPRSGTDSRSGADPRSVADPRSAWRSRHVYMAHFAVTDSRTGQFRAAEKFSRGAAGLAGAEAGSGAEASGVEAGAAAGLAGVEAGSASLRVWLEDWSAASMSQATFPLRLRASAEDMAIDLVVDRGKRIVLQGDRGLSRKGPEPGNASYYYSLTRMPTTGTVRTSAGTWRVSGTSWLDREWSTSVLSPGVTGWDWISLQLSDSTELMLYRLRRSGDTVDPFSSAMFIDADGSARSFTSAEFRMSPVATWRSGDGTAYPVAWRIEIPGLDLELDISTPVENQELDLTVRYWEGMVRAHGVRAGRSMHGRGYLEMTGYASDQDDRMLLSESSGRDR